MDHPKNHSTCLILDFQGVWFKVGFYLDFSALDIQTLIHYVSLNFGMTGSQKTYLCKTPKRRRYGSWMSGAGFYTHCFLNLCLRCLRWRISTVFERIGYVWWKKCWCTSWDIQIPVHNLRFTIYQHGLCGFLPSTCVKKCPIFQTKTAPNQTPPKGRLRSRPPPRRSESLRSQMLDLHVWNILAGNPDLSMAAILMKGRCFLYLNLPFGVLDGWCFGVPKKHHPLGLKQQRKSGTETGRIKILRWVGESIVLPQTPRLFLSSTCSAYLY